jgi:diguanylate cyclase
VDDSARGPGSLARLFVTHAAITLVPVLLLGTALAFSYRAEARRRGVATGRSEAQLVAQTAIEPFLEDRPLQPSGLAPVEHDILQQIVSRSVRNGSILRLRLRTLSGQVVFSDDGSGFNDAIEAEPLEAATGRTVAKLTKLNSDSNDHGPIGPAAVEVYLPLVDVQGHRIGVLEVYLPYAPISRDVTAGLYMLERDLALGLAALYLALLAITASVSRGLRREAARNAWLAEHDTLTGLPNRVLFRRRAEEAMRDRPTTLAVINLDGFKEVNDSLGHRSGDIVLTEIAERLAGGLPADATVARLNGDEFGLVLPGAGDPAPELHRTRTRIVDEVTAGELRLTVEASIGYVISGEDGDDLDELLQHADVAMELAKADHAGVLRYDPARDDYDADNLTLLAELRRAVDGGQLVLHYQPKTTISDGRVEAVEALVRWEHPDRGLLYPDRFVPLAERTDVIDALTRWVLTTALTETRSLGLPVAVNVSVRNLVRAEFAQEVIDILEQADAHPSRLLVEMTETAVLSDPRRVAATLATLSRAGVRASLDDFGQGQTSLGHLAGLPLYELKIDKGFVAELSRDPAHAAIVGSIITLAHRLGLRVVAEGVETEEDGAVLAELGCDVAQGFLIARPMPVADLRAWLRGRRAAPVNQAP